MKVGQRQKALQATAPLEPVTSGAGTDTGQCVDSEPTTASATPFSAVVKQSRRVLVLMRVGVDSEIDSQNPACVALTLWGRRHLYC